MTGSTTLIPEPDESSSLSGITMDDVGATVLSDPEPPSVAGASVVGSIIGVGGGISRELGSMYSTASFSHTFETQSDYYTSQYSNTYSIWLHYTTKNILVCLNTVGHGATQACSVSYENGL